MRNIEYMRRIDREPARNEAMLPLPPRERVPMWISIVLRIGFDRTQDQGCHKAPPRC